MPNHSKHRDNPFVPILLNYQFINNLKKLPSINRIYLYGSRARGDHSPTSDIDLAIDCPYASQDDWRTVLDIIEDADTLLKIDCVRLDQTDEMLKKNIFEQGILIYEKSQNKTKI